ncbi:bactofilin family protein [Candidatus Ruminimicrobiellum ovillum]|uniref:bactofilin family protein n=1 Tax=Candidatus Ruminimicrobiellum ovillum TaxID=1947927 RepID=UPI0035595E3D
MSNKKNRKLFDTIETLIGNGTTFKGDITVSNSLRIDGVLIGNVKEAANVIVGETAQVKGNINANYVVIDGIVEGNITAGECIELLTKSKVTGDLTTSILSINEGAVFKGKSLMLEKEENIEENI